MEKPQGAAISPSLRTMTRVPNASGDTAAPLLFLVQSEKCTTDRSESLAQEREGVGNEPPEIAQGAYAEQFFQEIRRPKIERVHGLGS